ncbi:hypothetical protein ACFLTV_01400, partial [Chloroflexota bacterium]
MKQCRVIFSVFFILIVIGFFTAGCAESAPTPNPAPTPVPTPRSAPIPTTRPLPTSINPIVIQDSLYISVEDDKALQDKYGHITDAPADLP